MNKLIMSCLAGLFMSPLLVGCVTTSGSMATGNQGRVAIVDPNALGRPGTVALTMADYTAFAENVTNKMLSSRLARSWGNPPKLIVYELANSTDDESIVITDIYDRITETILNSGVARLVREDSVDFDYSVEVYLTSTRHYGENGEELAHFKLEFKLFTVDGELVGQWSDVLALAKAKKSFF